MSELIEKAKLLPFKSYIKFSKNQFLCLYTEVPKVMAHLTKSLRDPLELGEVQILDVTGT